MVHVTMGIVSVEFHHDLRRPIYIVERLEGLLMAEIRRAPPKGCIINPVNNEINYRPQLVSLLDFWTINSIRGLTDRAEFRYRSNGERRIRWLIWGYLKLWSTSLVSAHNIITWWLQRLFGIVHLWIIAEDLCFFLFFCRFFLNNNFAKSQQPTKITQFLLLPIFLRIDILAKNQPKLPQFLPYKSMNWKKTIIC